MVNTYRLINPHIKGEFKTSLKSKIPLKLEKNSIKIFQNTLIIIFQNFTLPSKKVALVMVNITTLKFKKKRRRRS